MIKVGCCGFPVKKEKYFEKFNLVEVQETFYQLPKIERVKKWKNLAPKDFEFTIKSWQIITHPFSSPTYKKLKEKIGKKENYGFFKNTKEVFEAFERTIEIANILNAKIILFQCPNSFRQEKINIENIKNFFKKVKTKKFIFALELRGNWDKTTIKGLCQKLNLIHCVDPFKQKPLFGKINYFRLHGKPNYNLKYKYTKKDLKEILKFCNKKENYVFFNNISMFEDALEFKNLI